MTEQIKRPNEEWHNFRANFEQLTGSGIQNSLEVIKHKIKLINTKDNQLKMDCLALIEIAINFCKTWSDITLNSVIELLDANLTIRPEKVKVRKPLEIDPEKIEKEITKNTLDNFLNIDT